MNKSKSLNSHTKTYSKFDAMIKSQFLKQMNKLERCYVEINDNQGRYVFGNESSDLKCSLTVHNNDFYHAIAFNGSIGAAEQFMIGHWSTTNLTDLVRVFVRNQDLLDQLEGGSAWLKNSISKIAHFLNKNTKNGSKKNISNHYDLGNEMFKYFLDEKMMYSSAIFQFPDDTLEKASDHKLKTICEKLNLSSQDKLIEIGTGWGGLALYAAENYGCHVTTTTISSEQYEYTKDLIKQKQLEDKITLLKEDYRNLTGTYNKLVSVEMIEAVGHQFLETYIKKCNDLLTDDGQALIQAITIEDYRYKQSLKSVDFIKKYIFPGSFIPSVSAILNVSARSTKLKLYHMEDFGMSYAQTLNAWSDRFNKNIKQIDALGYDDTFKRMWEFYFSYCEGGFIEKSISVVHLLLTKPQCRKDQMLVI